MQKLKITGTLIIICCLVSQAAQGQERKFKKRGFMAVIESQFNKGYGSYEEYGRIYNNDLNSYGGQVTFGGQFNPYFSLGYALGVVSYNYGPIAIHTIDSRISFLNRRVSPTLNFNTGFRYVVEDTYGFGFVQNTAVGLRIYMGNRSAFIFKVGQKSLIIEGSWYTFAAVNMGVMF